MFSQVCPGGVQVTAGRRSVVPGFHIPSWQTRIRLARDVRLMQTSIRNYHTWYFFFKRQSPSNCRYHGCLPRPVRDARRVTSSWRHVLAHAPCAHVRFHGNARACVTWLRHQFTWRWKLIHWRAISDDEISQAEKNISDLLRCEESRIILSESLLKSSFGVGPSGRGF